MSKSVGIRVLIPAFLVASAFTSLQAAPTKIDLAVKLTISNGRIIKISKTARNGGQALSKPAKSPEEYPSRVPKSSILHLTIEEVHLTPPPENYDIRDQLEIAFTHSELAENKPAVLTEPFLRVTGNEPALKSEPITMAADLIMDLPGQKYALKINRYDSLEDKLRGKNPSTVYEGNFSTYRVYYVGLNAGWLLPIGKRFDAYALYHTDPADASDGSLQTIRRTRSYQTKGVLFASIFPAGVEPEAPLSWRNIHLNLGTELSSSIMKSLYVGAGYDFRFFSINIFYGITKASVLPDEYAGFVDRTIANKKISSLPLIEKWDTFFGAAVSFPFSLATIFGKMIGL